MRTCLNPNFDTFVQATVQATVQADFKCLIQPDMV